MTLKHSGSSSLGFIPAVIIATILVAACATLPPQSHGQQLPSRSRQRQLLPGLNKAERLQGSNQNASVAQDTLVPIFLPAVTCSSGGFAAGSTVVADVNGDGKGDLVVGNGCSNSDCSGDSSVGVLLGNGDGTFRTALTWDAGGPFVASLATADLNGDGKPDIVTVTNAGVSVLLGNGDGQFQPAVNYCCAGEAESIAIGDVNGDGKPDVIVAIWYSSVGVLLGNGGGTFQMPLIYDSGDGGSTFVAVADLPARMCRTWRGSAVNTEEP